MLLIGVRFDPMCRSIPICRSIERIEVCSVSLLFVRFGLFRSDLVCLFC